jgi:hypothetical protein
MGVIHVTGRRRRWLFALGTTAALGLVSVGGVALAASLRSSPRTPKLLLKHPVARTYHHAAVPSLASRTRLSTQAIVRTPADEQYGNPLEGKLCADGTGLDFTTYTGGGASESFFHIKNCGDTPLVLLAAVQSDPDSLFLTEKTLSDRFPDCPGNHGAAPSLALAPGEICVAAVDFEPNAHGAPSVPPGEYDDTWTYSGGTASLTIHLVARVLDPATDGILCPDQSPLFFGPLLHSETQARLTIRNCGVLPVVLGEYQKGDPGSPFDALDTVFDNANQCPIPGGPVSTLTLQPNDTCVLIVGFGPHSPDGSYTDTWTFPGNNASLTLPLTNTSTSVVN